MTTNGNDFVNDSSYLTRRLLLKAYPMDERVQEYAAENGWPVAGMTEEDPDAGTVREVMWMVEPSLVLHYAEDRMTETAYVMASSSSPVQAEDLADRLVRELDVRTFGELLSAFDEADNFQEISLAVNRWLTSGGDQLPDLGATWAEFEVIDGSRRTCPVSGSVCVGMEDHATASRPLQAAPDLAG